MQFPAFPGKEMINRKGFIYGIIKCLMANKREIETIFKKKIIISCANYRTLHVKLNRTTLSPEWNEIPSLVMWGQSLVINLAPGTCIVCEQKVEATLN